MTALSNIPPQALLPLQSFDLSELRAAAEQSDQVFLHSQLDSTRDKQTVMARIAEDFELPSHFGGNLDALYDCITDLQPDSAASSPGFVIVLESLPDTARYDSAERNRLLDVFRDAADFFDDQSIMFRVFYSVALSGGGKSESRRSA